MEIFPFLALPSFYSKTAEMFPNIPVCLLVITTKMNFSLWTYPEFSFLQLFGYKFSRKPEQNFLILEGGDRKGDIERISITKLDLSDNNFWTHLEILNEFQAVGNKTIPFSFTVRKNYFVTL